MRSAAGQLIKASAAGVLIALGTVSPAAAWAPVIELSSSRWASASPGAVASAGAQTIGVVYLEEQSNLGRRVIFRRSSDQGNTWRPPAGISSGQKNALDVAIAGLGSSFDIVWTQQNNGGHQLVYVRSSNRGADWSVRKSLSPPDEYAVAPRIVRGANGRVAVVWVGSKTGEQAKLYGRVSIDGGATFGPRRLIGLVTTVTTPLVAIGASGKIHVVWSDAILLYSRSADDGASWSSQRVIAEGLEVGWELGLAAKDRTIIVGYTRVGQTADRWLVTRRSLDNGRTWEAPRSLVPKSANDALTVALSVNGNRWNAAIAQCTDASCQQIATVVKSSTDGGATWSKSSTASPQSHITTVPIGVQLMNVVWMRQADGGATSDIFARR